MEIYFWLFWIQSALWLLTAASYWFKTRKVYRLQDSVRHFRESRNELSEVLKVRNEELFQLERDLTALEEAEKGQCNAVLDAQASRDRYINLYGEQVREKCKLEAEHIELRKALEESGAELLKTKKELDKLKEQAKRHRELEPIVQHFVDELDHKLQFGPTPF